MAFFYLSAARGDMQLHVLEACARRRLQHLAGLLRAETLPAPYCEYVLEGGLYDNAGHHVLALASALGGGVGAGGAPPLARLVRRGELELFRLRLAALSPSALRSFANRIVRHINKLQVAPPHLNCLHMICQRMMLKGVAQHMCSPHATDCTLHCISVNFRHCLPLVAARKVDIVNGEAKIYCGQWRQYLIYLFKTHLSSRTGPESSLTLLKNDPRVMELVFNLLQFNTTSQTSPNDMLCSGKVDSVSKYFPPCMQSLHRTVRQQHRLSHDQRFHYSLFLKDIGMPVREAIDFWGAEYRHPSRTNVCSHSWSNDQKKFIYGIRHLYGLEGGRKSYSSVSCARIQAVAGARSEGGCPFKHFDVERMKSVLNADFVNSPGCMTRLNTLKSSGNCLQACEFYLTKLFPNPSCDKMGLDFLNLSPVKFYKRAASVSVTKPI